MIVFATSRLGKRGVVANRHQTWVRDAMDATVSRVRFRARANDANADAKSCGPDTPTLVSSALDDDLVRDGSKKARFPERARYKRVPWKGTVLERVKVPSGKGRSGR
jgi:hypothetical protein